VVEHTNQNPVKNDPLPERTVAFPKEGSIGTLFVRDWHGTDDPFFSQGVWEEFGVAQGNVTVPAGQKLGVQMNQNAKENAPALAKLNPNDLQALEVWDINNDSMQAIAHLTALKWFFVYESHQLGDEGLERLIGCSSLEFIGMFDCGKLDTSFETLKQLPNLTDIELGNTELTPCAIRGVSELPHLEYLWLEYMPMNDAQFIANFTLPRSLRHFAFGACESLTDAALAHIAKLYRAAEVPLLRFGVLHTQVSETGIIAVLKSMPTEQVESVWISHTGTTARVMDELGGMTNLEELWAAGLPITDEGLNRLEVLTKLESLDLSQTKITDKAVETLSVFKNLKRVDVRETGVTSVGVEKLKQALPVCEVLSEGTAVEWW
jgi:hypothetical protein